VTGAAGRPYVAKAIMPTLQPPAAACPALPRDVNPTGATELGSALDLAMSRYAEGNDAAFSDVFSGLAPRVQAFLYRLSGSVDLAHDLTQETFLRIHRARGSFVPGNPVLPWAYAIARNCFVGHARSRKFKAARRSVDIADHELAAGLEASAEAAVLAHESARIVKQVLAEMSVVNREAFILLRFEGLSVAAAAQVLGASQGAVKLRAFRAYEALRTALKASEQGAPQASRTERVQRA
jgi:RNA polymerase sigma-70 factor (ECF subfamily)